MNSEQFIDIIETSLLPTKDQFAVQSVPSSVNTVISQQENDPKHKSIQIKIWLFSNGILTMNYPSQ